MDIQIALGVLEGAVITKQKEIDALVLAQAILQDKFSAEFSTMEQLQTQANNLSLEKEALISENTSLKNLQEQIAAESPAEIIQK